MATSVQDQIKALQALAGNLPWDIKNAKANIAVYCGNKKGCKSNPNIWDTPCYTDTKDKGDQYDTLGCASNQSALLVFQAQADNLPSQLLALQKGIAGKSSNKILIWGGVMIVFGLTLFFVGKRLGWW